MKKYTLEQYNLDKHGLEEYTLENTIGIKNPVVSFTRYQNIRQKRDKDIENRGSGITVLYVGYIC